MQTLLGAEEIYQKKSHGSKVKHFAFLFGIQFCQISAFQQEIRKNFDHQLAGEHLTFAIFISDSEGENNDSHDDDALLLPLSANGVVSKGKSTSAHVNP